MAHGTVHELTGSGAVTARRRTSVDDLEFAATWLEAYEGDPDDDPTNLTAAATAAAYLRREVARRTWIANNTAQPHPAPAPTDTTQEG